MLRIIGELDTSTAEAFADHADAAVGANRSNRAAVATLRLDQSGSWYASRTDPDSEGSRDLYADRDALRLDCCFTRLPM